MRLVRVAWIEDDMELARDVPAPKLGSAPLLRQGVRLTTGLSRRLESLGVRAVWVEDDMGEGIVPIQPLPDHVRASTERAVHCCLEAAEALASGLSSMPTQALGPLQEAAARLTQALADCPEAALALDDLETADTYTYSHSVRVATLGLLIGQRIDRIDGWVDFRGERRFDRKAERMTQLAMGLLIHDIGKLAIPSAILNKPGPLTVEEWELMKTHPEAGASLLGSDRISPIIRCIVRDHHERWDGLGYPVGRRGDETHQFARIAAVADVYDAITADRPYRAATPPHIGVREVCAGAGTQFDPGIVEHFKRIAMPYPVGYTIIMPGGTEGVVAGVDPDEPEFPVLRYRDERGTLVERAVHIVDGVVQETAENAPATPSPAAESLS